MIELHSHKVLYSCDDVEEDDQNKNYHGCEEVDKNDKLEEFP